MKNSKSLLKQAEQNVINQAKFWTDFFDFIDSIQYSLSNKLDIQQDRDEFAEGFGLIRQAAYKQMQFALARNFAFVGVGGEEATKYSKEQAKRLLGGRYSTVQFLDKWCRVPSSWSSFDAEELNAEIKEALS